MIAPMPMVHPNAAAIDVGSTLLMAAVRADRTSEPVHQYGTFTTDLHRLAAWFAECGVETVAMESTSVYWIPIYELLDARGFTVFLVNARDAKHVPGRKTDVSDAQWLQRLHSYGLLRASFRPEGHFIATCRTYVRQRERLLEYAASHIQHMQKALTEMNLQLHHVVADITGATGLRIIRAILSGEHDPKVLARFRDYRCHCNTKTIEKALTGNYRAERLFALEQALALYDVYRRRFRPDIRMEAVLKELSIGHDHECDTLPSSRRRTDQVNGSPSYPSALLHVARKASQVNGFRPYLALKLVAECSDTFRPGQAQTLHLLAAPRRRTKSPAAGCLRHDATHRHPHRCAPEACRCHRRTTDAALGAFYKALGAHRQGQGGDRPARRSQLCSTTPCVTNGICRPGASFSTPGTVSDHREFLGAPRHSALFVAIRSGVRRWCCLSSGYGRFDAALRRRREGPGFSRPPQACGSHCAPR